MSLQQSTRGVVLARTRNTTLVRVSCLQYFSRQVLACNLFNLNFSRSPRVPCLAAVQWDLPHSGWFLLLRLGQEALTSRVSLSFFVAVVDMLDPVHACVCACVCVCLAQWHLVAETHIVIWIMVVCNSDFPLPYSPVEFVESLVQTLTIICTTRFSQKANLCES